MRSRSTSTQDGLISDDPFYTVVGDSIQGSYFPDTAATTPSSTTTTDYASAYFSTDINPNLLVGVALHELTHAMGRVPYGSAPDVFDLFRFTSQNVRLFQGGATAPAAYFSLDNGATKIADYGQRSD